MSINPEKNRRILVIDDNRAIHEDFRKILARPGSLDAAAQASEEALFGDAPTTPRLPEFEIDSAFQGREGLVMIEQSLQEDRPYAMAFVDVRMPPGWDGVETTANIWQKYPDLQVVICTAFSDYSWEAMLNKLGYSDRLVILKKPFDTVEVMQLAVAMTEKWRLYQQAKLRLDDLEKMVHERTLELRNTNGELLQANELLRVATEKTQKMAESVLIASKAKGEFLANMSHEIRTPMNGVIGMVELLVNTDLTPEQREFAGIIKISADSLLSIINDILDFSKIEAGKLALEQVPFDLRETLKQSAELLRPKALAKGVELNCVVDPDVETRLMGDPSRLRQILLNLLSNAVKFTETGSIVLRVAAAGGTGSENLLRFTVQDTGIGMSEEVQRILFQSFTQADASTTRRFGGTGLGLAICRKLVELMGGTIGLTSAVGQGSTFWFTLPWAAQKSAAPVVTASHKVPAAPVAHEPAGANGVRVLLAEDNKVNQLVASKQLKRLGYTELAVVGNGREAVEACQLRPFDVILMDCQMPEMDGYLAAQRIREWEGKHGRPAAYIVAMTANAMQGDRELCLAAGMNDYLSKPVNERDLKEAFERYALAGRGGGNVATVGQPA